jgi:hypothetical protein
MKMEDGRPAPPVELRSTWTAEGGCPHVVWNSAIVLPDTLESSTQC